MKKISFSIYINAPRERVWDVMLGEDTYREWTKVFNAGSRFVGSWDEGSEMRFLGVDENGVESGGMYSRIKVNRLHEFISIEHIGLIQDGEIDTTSDEVKKWTPAFENYTFIEKDGGTEVLVEMDISDEWATMFDEMWPKALEALKELVESKV